MYGILFTLYIGLGKSIFYMINEMSRYSLIMPKNDSMISDMFFGFFPDVHFRDFLHSTGH